MPRRADPRSPLLLSPGTACAPRTTSHWPHLAAALFLARVAGCAGTPHRRPVPQALTGKAEVPGIPLARLWGDEPPPWIGRLATQSPAELRAQCADSYARPHNYLAISGGGPDGAFGPGLLNGWTAAGTRPEFNIVTRLSTGALTAPFAFLGPKYDKVIEGYPWAKAPPGME